MCVSCVVRAVRSETPQGGMPSDALGRFCVFFMWLWLSYRRAFMAVGSGCPGVMPVSLSDGGVVFVLCH